MAQTKEYKHAWYDKNKNRISMEGKLKRAGIKKPKRQTHAEKMASDPVYAEQYREQIRLQARVRLARNRQNPDWVARRKAYNEAYQIRNANRLRAQYREKYLKTRNDPQVWRDTLDKHSVRRHRLSTKRLETLAGRPRPSVCEICGGIGGGRSKRINVVWDHDHVTGKFRGWICSGCNSVLGYVNDNPARLRKLSDYLANGGFGSGPIEVIAPRELVDQTISSLEAKHDLV